MDNKRSIHLGKTESILFGSSKKIRKQSTMNITCGENKVDATENVKYLGVSLGQIIYSRKLIIVRKLPHLVTISKLTNKIIYGLTD